MLLFGWLWTDCYAWVLATGILFSLAIGLMLYGINGTKLVFRRFVLDLLLYVVFALFFSSNVGSMILSNINDRAVWTKHYVGKFLREKNVIN